MSEFFVRRPIVAIVIAILMTLIGGVCILALPIAQYPQIAPPEIQVQTHFTGADALTIEQSVAAPIEQQMSGVDNMNYMYSINANSGDIRLIVNFDVATDPNIDQVLTQLRVAQAQSQLPADVNNYGLTVKKSVTAPLMLVSLNSPNGTFVRVKDIARIDLGAQTYNLRGRLNGRPAAILALYQLPGTNAVKAAQSVRKLMAEAKQRFPADIDYAVSLDQTLSVTEGISEILKTLFEALALVVLVVFVFLQGWRATLIPLCAVPVSLVGTFVLFPLFGFSINTLSLFGLVLAIGLVVDDAIVVVEAVERHIEQGMSPRDAALKAMEELSGPVV